MTNIGFEAKEVLYRRLYHPVFRMGIQLPSKITNVLGEATLSFGRWSYGYTMASQRTDVNNHIILQKAWRWDERF